MNENIIYILWIVGLALLGLVCYLLYRLYKVKKRTPKDRESGQNTVSGVMQRFARSNGFRFLGPGRFAKGEKTAALDAVVVGYFGVLGVKALGYNGEVYGSPSEAEWLQVAPNGERTRFANPVTEASADVRVLREVLFGAKQRQVPVEVLCVFTNKNVQVAAPKNTGHYRMKELKALLGKEKYLEDTGLDLDKVFEVLQSAYSQA